MKRKIRYRSEKLLESTGMRRTKHRIAVLAVLLEKGKPLTQEQIALALADNAPNKVTIYRTLDTLCRAELVHRAFLHNRTWYFESAHHCDERRCHPHFTCRSCGNTHCLTQISLPPLVSGLHKGFIIHRQQVRLDGLCPDCSSLQI
ncbi:MAG: transcriptional repressor [Planctomycetota bacterium]